MLFVVCAVGDDDSMDLSDVKEKLALIIPFKGTEDLPHALDKICLLPAEKYSEIA